MKCIFCIITCVSERATRICVQMCAPTCHDESFNILFLIKVGKYCASRNDIACGGDITS